jgi:hypothetical protein
VLGSTRAFKYPVRTVRIRHQLELPVVFNKLIYQQFGIAVMHIVIAGSVYVQQVAAQVFGIGYRLAFYKYLTTGVIYRHTHITLLVNIVIAQLPAYGSYSNAGFVNFRVLEHQVKGT